MTDTKDGVLGRDRDEGGPAGGQWVEQLTSAYRRADALADELASTRGRLASQFDELDNARAQIRHLMADSQDDEARSATAAEALAEQRELGGRLAERLILVTALAEGLQEQLECSRVVASELAAEIVVLTP